MILNAKKVRIPGESDDTQDQVIVIDEEWKEKLLQFPQFASKSIHSLMTVIDHLIVESKGRMISLLKKRSQLSLAQKPRKKYEALVPQKRFRPNPGEDAKMKEEG